MTKISDLIGSGHILPFNQIEAAVIDAQELGDDADYWAMIAGQLGSIEADLISGDQLNEFLRLEHLILYPLQSKQETDVAIQAGREKYEPVTLDNQLFFYPKRGEIC